MNVATSLKEDEAAVLTATLNEMGYKTLHSFLKALINREAPILTSNQKTSI